ncbi:hypothetical protein [Candidatus Tisiphia endosymbiont of Dascillus cervinus]|uniref:hypothetical protein n=1 Tax=Candidatus Tisiphia endosymbiont of Dascillus cervinus TaxID=3066253 RepID=UPI00312C70E8
MKPALNIAFASIINWQLGLTTKKEQHILHMTIHLDEVEMGVKMLLDEFRRISIPKENSALQKILEKTVLHK